MRSICKLLVGVCLLFMPAALAGQDRIRTATVGPNGDQTRVVIALSDSMPDGDRFQSMIIDLAPGNNKTAEPSGVQLDLMSTSRTFSSRQKRQLILILRWEKDDELEVRCQGKWTRQAVSPALEKIISATKAVLKTLPTDIQNSPKEFPLAPDLEQRISSVFDSLATEKFPCLRDLH